MEATTAASNDKLAARAGSGTYWTVVALCFLVAVAEGLEIQSFGVAASDIRAYFDMEASAIGILAGASIFGLIFGSLYGGRLADRVGRKRVLVVSVIGFCVFTIGTALSQSFEIMLFMRIMTGLALGGAMPNMVAMAAEAGDARGRVGRVSLVVAGAPVGGIAMGLFGTTGIAADWQAVFWFGGLAPVPLIPFLIFMLPGDRHDAQTDTGLADRGPAQYRFVLFGEGRAWQSIALWVGAFFTQLIIYLLLNWLPTLMRASGFAREEAATAIALFNLGGALGGIIFGRLMRREKRWPYPLMTYTGVVVTLLLLSLPDVPIVPTYFCAMFLGAFAIGSQLVLFGLSAETYAERFRGTGVGVSTAVGRVGSTVGPILAGIAVSAGATAATILPALLPLAVLAGTGSVMLARRKHA